MQLKMAILPVLLCWWYVILLDMHQVLKVVIVVYLIGEKSQYPRQEQGMVYVLMTVHTATPIAMSLKDY